MTTVAFRQAYLLDTLGPYIVRDNSTADWALFEDPTTPQAKALQWLSEDDLFSSDPESMEYQTLLERYVLAVLVFSTNLQDTSYGDYTFSLDPATSVCEWNNDEVITYYQQGVFCFVDSSVNETATNETTTYETTTNQTVTNQTVTILQFEFFGLSGVVPWEISLLDDLKTLSLLSNSLTGTVPKELSALTALEKLQLNANYLSGTVPEELSSLTELGTLLLDENNMSGTLPSGLLSSMSKLTYLALSSNYFQGAIPSEFRNLPKLEVLDLANNRLSGSIPTEVGLLSMLVTISIDNNRLSGTLPSEIGLLTKLETFNIRDNPGLTGTVPSEYAALTYLYGFYATNTSLTGSLEDLFCSREYGQDLSGDCGGTNPEIECSCCSYCCEADGEQCEYDFGYPSNGYYSGGSIGYAPVQHPTTSLLQLLLALAVIQMFMS